MRSRYKKSSAPRCLPPETGCGCINTPHGAEPYLEYGHKKCPQSFYGEPTRLFHNGKRCKYETKF